MRRHLLSIACLFSALNILGQSYPSVCAQSNDRLPAPAATSLGSQGDSSSVGAETALRGLSNDSDKTIKPASDSQSDNNVTGVSSAPGADAMMTRDLLLVNPNKGGQAPKPLQTFVGDSLRIAIDRSNITFAGLRGIMITVTNDTSRPLVIDGDSAKANLSIKAYAAIPVTVLQKSVLPGKGIAAQTNRTLTQIVPAALTIGITPTVEDFITIKKPIRKRYGPDERRRLAEASRFGKRILWPHQKTQGILYFKTSDTLSGAKVQIPVHTLFDTPDSALLSSG